MRYREIVMEDLPQAPTGNEDDQDYNGRFDPTQDSVQHLDLDDTRKPKLTLKMINRLKKIRSTKNLEMTKKQALLGIMYGIGQEDEDS